MGSCLLFVLCFSFLFVIHGIHSQIIDCNFEDESDPMCGFHNVDTDDASFKRATGSDFSISDAAPGFDHTYLNDTGHFLDTTLASFGVGTYRIQVNSPTVVLTTNTGAMCLQFYYHMFGPSLDSLHVYKKQAGSQVSIYNRTGNLGDVWNDAEINIDVVSGNFQVIFEATISGNIRGDVALDDISLYNAQCTPVTTPRPPTTPPPVPLTSYQCNFDDTTQPDCTPHNNPRNDFDWLFRQPGIIPNAQSPVYDHTTSTSAGVYLYVPEDSTQTADQMLGEVHTPLLQMIFQPYCMEFYYYMRGSQVGTLSVYAFQEGFPPPINFQWNMTGAQNQGYWNRGLVDIPPLFSNYRIAIEAARPRGYAGSIAVDDLNLFEGACPSEEVQCDFESYHICYFTQDRTDDMDWITGNGATPSYSTGPSNDHTYGNSTGFYMYIEASSPSNQGHIARLLSPVITETHGHDHCLIFWYHMYGEHIDDLNVYIANTTAPTNRLLLWSLSGNRGDKWRAAEVHLRNSVDFIVIFEATTGSSYQGDIALDDVWITSTEGCPGQVGNKNFSSITCDFEEIEICYWTQATSDDLDWIWQNGAGQDLANTGPTEDHTTGTPLGFYMYLAEDYLSFPGGKALISTPEAKVQPSTSCLEFWYHMYGRDIEELNVYMQQKGKPLPKNPVWTQQGDHGNAWIRAAVEIPPTNNQFSFVFEAVRGQSYRDNIALDDVKFYEGQPCLYCHYMYLDTTSYYLHSDDRADIYSPLIVQSAEPQCLQFYYYMAGYNGIFIIIYLTPWGQSLALDPHFFIYGGDVEWWIMAKVDIPPMDTHFQVIIEATYGFITKLGIDDINLISGACIHDQTTPNPMNGQCDFENGFDGCGYTHGTYRNFYWLLNSGSTATEGTGPEVDHTTGTILGQYMYIEASIPQRPNYIAQMYTPDIYHTPGSPMCMQFYAHMYGPDVGQIMVMADTGTNSETVQLLRLVGSAGNYWKPAAVDLTNMGDRFQVIFQGVVGFGIVGDMAIDDVTIKNEPCPGYAKQATSDFEMPGDLNGFKQDYEGYTFWFWYDSRVQDSFPKIPEGDGSFMYLNGSISPAGSSASLISPIMAGYASKHCVDFDYAIVNDDGGKLVVSVLQKGGVKQDLVVNRGPTSWVHGRQTVTEEQAGEEFQIFFTGQVGSQNDSYVAVDNLMVSQTACDDPGVPNNPSGQTSPGVIATTVILAVLLAITIGIIVVGAVYYYRRMKLTESLPSVKYTHHDNNDNDGSLAKDLTISNPNYDAAALQSNA